MSFLEELRSFLRRPTVVSEAEEEEYRRHFLQALEQREHQNTNVLSLRHELFHIQPRLGYMAGSLHRELAQAGLPRQEIPKLVKEAISMEIGLKSGSTTTTRELLLDQARNRLHHNVLLAQVPWRDVSTYARETRLIQVAGTDARITALGRAFLDLVGIQAIKWLLHVEVALSSGRLDIWRIDRPTVQVLVESPHLQWPEDWWEEVGPAINGDGVDRLEALGLLDQVKNPGWQKEDGHIVGDEYGYSVHEHALPVLAEIAQDKDSPMSVAVAAMIADDTNTRVAPSANHTAAVAVTARQTRLFVHEIRNALLPVQTAFEEIDRELRSVGRERAVARERDMVDRNLKRVLGFASELHDLMRLAGEIADVFDAGSAIRDAIATAQNEVGHTAQLALSSQLPAIYGPRQRFVLALLNLLRNAYQSTSSESPEVAIEATTKNGRLWIAVDDCGPGVPEDERKQIFKNGHTTRTTGSGHGLTLARQIIEDDMNGTLSYEDGSALGGARFVVTLPMHQGREP